METLSFHGDKEKIMFYTWGTALALITIFYNIVEGVVSVAFGIRDETIALFGFGLDSFVEVISGIGIWHMISRMRINTASNSDRFEQTALKVTGTAFYILAIGLIMTAAISLFKGTNLKLLLGNYCCNRFYFADVDAYPLQGQDRETVSVPGAAGRCRLFENVHVSFMSYFLFRARRMRSPASADSIPSERSNCAFSLKEGREGFEKAKGKPACSCQGKCKTGE